MDNVVLALSVAVAVIVVLLLSCWDSKDKKKDTRQPAPRSRPQRALPAVRNESDWGTGVANRNSRARFNDLSKLSGYDDYSEVAQYMSVEPEVYESHNRFTSDMGRSTSGASMLPVRDDPNDVVPWVGLRKPKYQEVFVSPYARQEHSESPDQMRVASMYCVG